MATVTARVFAVSAGRQSSDTTRRSVTPAGDTTSKSSQSISTTTRRTKIPRRAALLTGVPLGCILARAYSTPRSADAAGIDQVSTLTRRGMAKFVQDYVDAGRLACPFETRLRPAKGYFLLTRPGARHRPEIAAVCEWLQREASEHAAQWPDTRP